MFGRANNNEVPFTSTINICEERIIVVFDEHSLTYPRAVNNYDSTERLQI